MAVAGFVVPMKALSAPVVPDGIWRCEIKFDGYRAVAVLNGNRAELWSRNHKPLTADYPEIVAALEAIPCRNAVLDGEIVALDAAGRSRFQLLQARDASNARPPIAFYLFDLLEWDGRNLQSRKIEERRQAMEKLLKNIHRPLQLSPVFSLTPAVLLAEAKRHGLEGIIAKRPGSVYEPGRRSGAWIKCKIFHEQEFVIGGFTAPQNSRQFFGAVLVGYHHEGKLLYAGKVGTGFDTDLLRTLHTRFSSRQRSTCPFANLPMTRKPRFGQGMTQAEMRKVTWVRPELVAQIKFGEWTHDGLLRQPVFLGLRKDKAAREVRREASSTAGPEQAPRNKTARRRTIAPIPPPQLQSPTTMPRGNKSSHSSNQEFQSAH